jgi:hypothetical protein
VRFESHEVFPHRFKSGPYRTSFRFQIIFQKMLCFWIQLFQFLFKTYIWFSNCLRLLWMLSPFVKKQKTNRLDILMKLKPNKKIIISNFHLKSLILLKFLVKFNLYKFHNFYDFFGNFEIKVYQLSIINV